MLIYFVGCVIAFIISYNFLSKNSDNDVEIILDLGLSFILGLFSWLVIILGFIYFLIKLNRKRRN